MPLSQSGMLDLTIRPEAKRDMRQVWRYSQKTWSVSQADSHTAKLNAAIAQLRAHPEIGKPSDNVSLGLRRRAVERHVIYYRVRDDSLIIVRVLHDRMDPFTHLANDET